MNLKIQRSQQYYAMKLLNHTKNKQPAHNTTTAQTSLLPRSLFIFVMMLCLCRGGTAQNLGINLDDYQINAIASYTFSISFNQYALQFDIPAGSFIAVTFPSDYSTEMLHAIPLPGYDSTKTYTCYSPVIDCSSITITYSGSTFIFSGFFPGQILAADGFSLAYTLNNIKNPSTAKLMGAFKLTIFKGASIYFPPPAAGYSATADDVPITMRDLAYNLTVTDSTIYAISPWTITFKPTVRLNKLQLILSSKWDGEPIVDYAYTSSLSCSSVSHPAIQCYFSSASYIVQNIGYTSPGQAFDLTLSSMYSPSSLTSIGNIFVRAYQDGLLTESATINIAGSNFSSNILTRIKPVVTYLTGDKIKLEISFFVGKSSKATDNVTVTFPSDFAMPTTDSSYSFEVSNIPVSSMPIYYQPGNSTLTFSPFIDDQTSLLIKINITGLTRPRECKLTGTFQISTYRNIFSIMDSSPCCAVQLQIRQTLANPSVFLDNSIRLASGVAYFLKFTTSVVNLITTDSIRIQFPTDYSTQITAAKKTTLCAATTITANNLTNIKSMALVICSVQLNVMTLSNFLISNVPGSQTFTIRVGGLINPTASPSVGFTFATLSSAGNILQQVRGVPVTIGTSQFYSFSVTPGSSVACATGIKYTFQIGNNAPLSNGYAIQIVFPADYDKINYNILACTLNAAPVTCARLDSTYSGSNQTILLQVNFTISSTSTILVVTVDGVTNPPTTQPTGFFYAAILDSTGFSVDSSPLNVSVAMSTPGSWSSFTATASNYSAGGTSLPLTVSLINQQNVSLFFTMILPYTLKNGTTLFLTLFNSSYLIVGGSCTSSTFTPNCTNLTNLTTGNIDVSFSAMTFAATVGSLLQIQLHNITVFSYQQVQIKGDLFVGGYASLTTGFVSLPLLYAERVSTYSITQTSKILGAASDVTISITFSAQILSRLSYLKIIVPQEYTTSNHTFTFLNASFVSNSVLIAGLTNPTTSAYTPFLFAAYDAKDHIIAISSPIGVSQSFSLACGRPCRTCSALLCTSCYTSISWISEIYLRSSNSSCVSQCIPGEYLSNYTCLPCSTNCTTCLTYGANYTDGSSTTCLSCPATYLLQGGICYPSCPLGYYPSGTICASCLTNCRSCSNATACLSCLAPYVLNSTSCLIACPTRFVALTNVTTTLTSCLPCLVTACLVCLSSNTSSCITCAGGYYLQSGLCVINSTGCSGGLLPNWAGKCVNCECSTCSNMSHNCTSCFIGYFLYNFQCLTACPSGTFSSSSVCISCSSNCSVCTSSIYCNLCILPNALYVANATTASCYAVCPNGTIATVNNVTFSYLCSPCGANCATCWISITFCLTCKNGFFLHNSTCVASCPTPLWTINGSCLNCSSSCRSCLSSDPFNCSLCATNNYLFSSNNSCLSSCPSGYYANSFLLTCSLCSPLCLTCQNSSNCTSCIGGYWLYQAMCYNSCVSIDPLLYSYNGSCIYCQSQCTSCLSTPFQCISCNSSYYFYEPIAHTCTLSCVSPYYANGSICVACAYPCLTCDTKFNSCLSCNTTITSLSLLNGSCIPNCPNGYYSSSAVCFICPANCSTCDSSRCLTCLPYAYVYHSRCVLNCSEFADLPLTIDNYCSSCSQVPYCQACSTSVTQDFVCFMCVYPYVVFDGNCLNSCPQYYEVNPTSNVCEQSTAYATAMLALYEYNKPIMPPFAFFVIFFIIGGLLYWRSAKIYRFTYHCGYLIALITLIDTAFLMYGVAYLVTRYTGDYSGQQQTIPLLILATSFALKLLVLNAIFLFVVLASYWKDIRYAEWWTSNRCNSIILSILVCIFGCRMHKLYYSKLFGKGIFSFRVISVQKFYAEDVVNWAVFIIDLLDLSAFGVVAYNIFTTYSVLYISFYELAAIKMVGWGLIIYDMRKPDRGFFSGDEEEAERQILQEMKEKQAKKRKFQMENLAKLIRRKSAADLHTDKLYEHLFFDDFRSVYDPRDYQEVPVVPNRRIEKGINKGKFRKGKRITIEQKLRRFAESIKPTPIVAKDDSYLNGLIYWKPPKKLAVRKKQQPESQESMMKLLEDKQLFYKDELADIEIMDLDQESGIEHDSRMRRRRHAQKTIIADFDDKTNPNDTFDHFYDPTSLEMIEPEEDDFNGLMNRNYARRQHLPSNQITNKFDEQQLRVLYHQPLKKRKPKSRLNEISIRRF